VDPIFVLMLLRVFNTLMKLRILLLLLLPGLPKKVFFVMRTAEEYDLTFMMLLYMQMLSTEEEDKSSLLPESVSMLAC